MLTGDKLALRLVAPASVVWPGVSTPIGPSAAVLSKTLYARPLPSSTFSASPDLVQGSYTLRLDDAGESEWTFPNGPNSEGRLWRQIFDPSGHLTFLEVWLEGQLEQVVCIDTAQVSDGRGFSSTLDATDFAASLWGNGAGLQNGTSGQLQAVVYDPPTLQASLFDVQGWQDFSDASFTSLLQGLLNAALGLRLTPWQLLSNDPSSGGDGSVAVHGQDAWFLLKKAYERDWIVVQSPRDVIERATQIWVPGVADNFPASSSIGGSTLTTPTESWTLSLGTGGSATVGPSGGINLATTNASTAAATLASPTVSAAATSTWRALMSASNVSLSTAGTLSLTVTESSGDFYVLDLLTNSQAGFAGGSGLVGVVPTATIAPATSYSLMLECDGEWVWAFVNGQLVGIQRRLHATTTSVSVTLELQGGSTVTKSTLTSALLETMQPFLQRGTDHGDYVLPGSASTYPSGGLHARYYNDTDLQSDPNRLLKILAPTRSQAYAGSGTSEYANQQDATIAQQSNPLPGAATTGWSAKWFGAVYLKLSQGDYGLQIETPTGAAFSTAVRVWVGKTKWGDQLVDQWAWQNGNANYPFTVSAAALAGTLSYGGGTVARDGWYPIVIEYAVDGGTGGHAPQLIFTNTPAAYTDPGGTAIASGAQNTIIPATSLSPLGCIDQRYQSVSHFDLAQQTVQAFGYQASVEPQQLESGLFPGVLAPRIREGHDTDLVLSPPSGPRTDWVGPLRPQLANTWPLPGTLAAMRWRPGDGIRAQDQEINVWDALPRQILAFTRNLVPSGITSAVASLANRPKNPARSLKQQLYQATRWQRNYQRQIVTLTGNLINQAIAATGTGALSIVQTAASDVVVRAYLRISTATVAVPLNVIVNGSDQTPTLNGPFTVLPLNLNLSAVASPDGNGNINVAIKIPGATGSTVQYQLLVDVLR